MKALNSRIKKLLDSTQIVRRQELENIEGRRIDARKLKTENHMPFSDYFPEAVKSPFNYETPKDKRLTAKEVLYSGAFDLADAETVLSGDAENSEVISFFTDLYRDLGRNFSVYGEIDKSESDYWINSAVFIEGKDNIDEARERFRDYALPTKKDNYSGPRSEKKEEI